MQQERKPRWQTGLKSKLNPNYTWTSVRAAASGRWSLLLPALGIAEKFLNRRHGPCPACGGKDRFRFDDKNGTGSFFCSHCGAGDGFKLVQLVFDFTNGQALRMVAAVLGMDRGDLSPQRPLPPKPEKSLDQSASSAGKQRYLKRQWNRSVIIADGDPVDRYLRGTRRLALAAVPQDLRYCEQLEYRVEDQPGVWVTTGIFPAMIARILSPDGSLVGLHRTYLTTDGEKADVKPSRKLSAAFKGAIKGGAIRLFLPDDILGVAEGIETALACHVATGLPVWSTTSAGGLASLVVPDTVKELIIFADRDASGTGEKSARTLARRMLAEDRKVKILMPNEVGTDWADNV